MESLDRIALFPLGVILFPESRMPLHIFEERYKRLCSSAIEHNEVFGINFIDEERMHSVGCTARIAGITKKYPDGKLDITIEGVRRYEIIQLEQGGQNELSYARIHWIDDEPELRNKELAAEVITLFNELCDVAYKGAVETLEPAIWSAENKLPSFAVAQKSGLMPDQRQTLLLVRSENERLEMLKNHLEALLPKVKEAESMTELIRNDGYIVTWNKK
ncbi:MAG TPA: LON peptidase substrate-binding domain-containing protein [Candidatus Kapabacteria bacterium]|nr:LON peptidase substrate-binding domain-containing protein [Candidatus Kapabacteria bacterium]